MKFIIKREELLKSLQQVTFSFGKHPLLPILSNLLLKIDENILSVTGSDLEIEITAKVILTKKNENGAITVPARKFFDIWRVLPHGVEISVTLKEHYLVVRSGSSRFSLSTIPASNFPKLDDYHNKVELEIPQSTLKKVIEATQFSMAHQDVRYYLNGMLFETEGKKIRTVASDGHRLAIYSISIDRDLPNHSAIVPRKAVLEFMRLLNNSEEIVKLQINNNNIRAYFGNIVFTSKLVDAHFPNYQCVLPKNPNKRLTANSNKLKKALLRASILSNEKFRGVHLCITKNQLRITANNAEKEESEEILDVNYVNRIIEISFNVSYILDVLNTIKCEQVNLLITDENSSIQIEDETNKEAIYVIMPLRL